MIDGSQSTWWANTSTVICSKGPGTGVCGAKEKEATCGTCRYSWDSEVINVAYRLR